MSCRHIALLLIAAGLLAGCRTPQNSTVSRLMKRSSDERANVPPRKSLVDADEPFDQGDSSAVGRAQIELTEYRPGTGDIAEIDDATVVATVNSMPVFADEVLSGYARELQKVEGRMTPEQLNELKLELIKRSLPQHIEKAALVSTLRDDLTKDQRAKLDQQLEYAWEREIGRLQQEFKAGTRVELDRALEEQGTTLDALKPAFVAREMAMLHVSQKAKAPQGLTREELQAWYDEHRSEFEIQEKIRWQEIRISHNKSGGRAEAAIRLRTVRAALQRGDDFGEVAKAHSDSPKAESGGVWDWAPRGTLADAKLEETLFQLEPDRISVMETNGATVVFKVLERQPGGFKPFEEVKDQIEKKLSAEAQDQRVRSFIDAQLARSSVWTIFDAKPTGANPSSTAEPARF